MEHSPYCERDIRPPQDLKTYDLKGDYLIKAKEAGNDVWFALWHTSF